MSNDRASPYLHGKRPRHHAPRIMKNNPHTKRDTDSAIQRSKLATALQPHNGNAPVSLTCNLGSMSDEGPSCLQGQSADEIDHPIERTSQGLGRLNQELDQDLLQGQELYRAKKYTAALRCFNKVVEPAAITMVRI